MLISRKLAHKVQNRLQMIMSLIETEQPGEAVKQIRELSLFLSAHIESQEDEQARFDRENAKE
jgi:two-component sensor histidine kinase